MNKKLKKPKLGKLKWIIIILVVIAIVAYASMSGPSGTQVVTSKATKGIIKAYISQQAMTDLNKIYKITMPYSSRVKPVILEPGTPVKKGQTVATLDLSEINTKVQVAKAELESITCQIKLNKYREFDQTAEKESHKWIKTMEELLAITKIKITASQHVLEYAMQHKNALIQSGRAVSRIEQNQAAMEAAVKEVDLESAKLAYSAMDVFTSIWQLVPIYIKEHLNSLNIELEVLQAEKNKAEAELNLAETHLALANMKSPVDGVVLKRYVTNERFLQTGSQLLDIGVLKNLEVVANVLTTEAAAIKIGDPVDIFGAATGDSFIHGKVVKIEPQGFTDISSLGVKQQKVKVKINFEKGELDKLEKMNHTFGVGYRVYVKIYTSEAKNAVIIPRTALFKGSNNVWKVFVVNGNKVTLKNVKAGIMNEESAQITSGIKPGDQVVIAPPTSLSDGTKVKIL